MANTDELVPEYSAKWWIARLQEREKDLDEKWWGAAEKIVERYLDLRSGSGSDSNDRKYNMFWANVHIMRAALYATTPKPSVTRSNSDAKDDAARVAAMMLERILSNDMECDGSDMHAAFKYGVDDRLIPGMGQVWLRYDAEIEGEGENAKIIEESAPCDYVHWRDFLWSPARVWEEVWWVARRCWMKRKAFVKRFGQERYNELKSNYENASKIGATSALPKGFSKGRVEVFEVWCEDTNKVYFENRYFDDHLEVADDPLKLDNFFPCPKPLIATHTTSNFLPRADYTMVQDQYDELDVLNDRISVLTKALRVVGVFDKNQPELSKILTGSEFNMIPVDNWAMLAEKGGLKGTVDWFPVDLIAEVLEKLTIQRQAVIGQIYELTSISDIMRGASNPRETAKAQGLKAQYSSVRLQVTQQEVALWAARAMQIKAEIIGRHFQPATIIAQSQIAFTESAEYADAAVQLIKDYKQADYRIKISEESLSMADYNAERELRTQYITAVGQFLSQAAGLLESVPDALPFLLKMVQWVTSSFRGSSDIETVLDEAIEMAGKPQPPKPDPNAGDNQLKLQIAGMNLDASKNSDQTRIAIAQMTTQNQKDIAQMNNDTKLVIEDMATKLNASIANSNLTVEQQKAETELMIQRMSKVQEAITALTDHHQAAVQQANDHAHEMGLQAMKHAAEAATATKDRETAKESAKVEKTSGEKDFMAALKPLMDKVQAMQDHVTAPINFKRGPDNRIIGIERGGVLTKIRRGKDGRIEGL